MPPPPPFASPSAGAFGASLRALVVGAILSGRRPKRALPWAVLIAVAVLGALAAGCGRQPSTSSSLASASIAQPWFEDVTAKSGIHFIHEVTLSGNYLISEQMGSGVAFFDFDNDGRLDVYLVHNVSPAAKARYALFRQTAEGRFQDVSAGSGLDLAGWANGLAIGDVNNDGWPDVLITEFDRVRLLLNQQGTGKFQDITASAGITNAAWSVPAAFFDYDRDGWLDLAIGNYLEVDPTQKCTDAKGAPDFCGPFQFPATLTRLFRNVSGKGPAGNLPRFEDVTVASGLARYPGKAMGMVCADFDGDRWPDILVTDDGIANRLFVNQRNGTFVEQAIPRGLGLTGVGATASNMGIALGDVDGDGLFDVFVPHLSEENHTLWMQGPPGIYQDRSAAAGLIALAWHGTGFAPVLADFDHDGDLDLAVANGLVRRRPEPVRAPVGREVATFWAPYAQPNQLFANNGQARFSDVSVANPGFCGESLVGRGLACGDFDNDGAPDLLLSSAGGPARLYRNVASARGHWLGVRAVDPSLGGRDAYGALVTVEAKARRWVRLVQPGHSYCSSNDPRAHFGLGAAATVDRISVVWSDGAEETFPGGVADRYLVLRKGAGVKVVAPVPATK